MTAIKISDLVLSKAAKGDEDNSRVTILKQVNAKFESGKVNAIMGANGCGKTTLLDIVYGFRDEKTKTSGKILVDEKPRDFKNWFWNVSYIQQESYQIDKQTARSVIQFAIDIKNAEMGTSEKLENFTWMIEELYVQDVLDKDMTVLSGGERQRVLLAAELVMTKNILILDEPTSDLDSHLALNLMIFLKKLAVDKGVMVILTIHQPSDQIFKIFDNLLFMNAGMVLYDGEAAGMEAHLASHGVVKPKEWLISEFIFEAFYGDSHFEEILASAAAVSAYNHDVETKAEENVSSSNLTTQNMETFHNPEINFRKSFYLTVRKLKLQFKIVKFIMAIILSSVFFPIMAYLVQHFYLTKYLKEICGAGRTTGLGKAIVDAAGTSSLLLEILSNPLIFGYFVLSQFMALTAYKDLVLQMVDVSVQVKTEIQKNYYSPYTLSISTISCDIFMSIFMFLLTAAGWASAGMGKILSIGGWLIVFLNILFSILVCRLLTNFFKIENAALKIGSFLQIVVVLVFSFIPFIGTGLKALDMFFPGSFAIILVFKFIVSVFSFLNPINFIYCFYYAKNISENVIFEESTNRLDIQKISHGIISQDQPTKHFLQRLPLSYFLEFLKYLARSRSKVTGRENPVMEAIKNKKALKVLVPTDNGKVIKILREIVDAPAYNLLGGYAFNKYFFLLAALCGVALVIFLNIRTYPKRLSPSISLSI